MFNKNLFKMLLLTAVLAFAGCQCNKGRDIPDVSGISSGLKIHRFEQEAFAIDSNNVAAGLNVLKQKYPAFTDFFLRFGPIPRPEYQDMTDTSGYAAALRVYLTHPEVRHVADTCQLLYKDFSTYEKEFDQAFKFFKYYFPKAQVPELYTYVSMFSYGAPVGDGFIGIGLDFFLGENYGPYMTVQELAPYYVRRTLNNKHIVPTVIYALADDIVGEPHNNRMIDIMISNGKKRYIQDILLPTTADSLKFGFTQRQINTCVDGEADLYKMLLDQQLLFSVDQKKFRKFVSQGPFNPQMPAENPGNSGSWLGLQMVKAYMERTPGATLEGMLKEEDVQKFLQKYRPH